MSRTQQTGDKGESIATHYLLQNGYEIIATNWSTRLGELDIIAKYGETYIFIEVKSRHSHNTESAFASITSAKREKMLKAIYQYLHDNELDDVFWRVDAIGIALQQNQAPIIDHVEDAFDW